MSASSQFDESRELEALPQYIYKAPCLIYNGGLWAEPQRGPGAEPPEVESFLALKCPMKAAKFAVLYLANCTMHISEQYSVA